MKTLFATSVSALFLLTTSLALAHSENAMPDGAWASGIFAVNVIWPPVLFAVSIIWQPVLFVIAILSFGILAMQRLDRKAE